MLRFKHLVDKKFCIIEDQNVHIFHTGNLFINTVSLERKYTDGMMNCPIISLLSTMNYNELAVYDGKDMKLYEFKSSSPAIEIYSLGGFMCMGRKNVTEGKVHGDQLLLVYPENFNVNTILNKLSVSEVSF